MSRQRGLCGRRREIDRGAPAELATSLAKLHISESFVRSGLDAITVHGGYGFATEYEVERSLRDAIGSRLYSGTSDIHRNLAARLMGLHGTGEGTVSS
jgi:alkylation response protein AidB-like acyl-CoA dehydrogenase